MSYQSVANHYRETEVLSASPARLLLITFDFLIAQMTRARIGIESKRPDVTMPALDKARTAVGELMAAVDVTRPGELPHRLVSIYAFLLAELVEMGRTPDPARLNRHIRLVSELREAFAACGERPSSAAVA